MTPLERAARAACEAAGFEWIDEQQRFNIDESCHPIDEDWLKAARAILTAIREPSLLSGQVGMNRLARMKDRATLDEVLNIWQAMIDAMLAEEG